MIVRGVETYCGCLPNLGQDPAESLSWMFEVFDKLEQGTDIDQHGCVVLEMVKVCWYLVGFSNSKSGAPSDPVRRWAMQGTKDRNIIALGHWRLYLGRTRIAATSFVSMPKAGIISRLRCR